MVDSTEEMLNIFSFVSNEFCNEEIITTFSNDNLTVKVNGNILQIPVDELSLLYGLLDVENIEQKIIKFFLLHYTDSGLINLRLNIELKYFRKDDKNYYLIVGDKEFEELLSSVDDIDFMIQLNYGEDSHDYLIKLSEYETFYDFYISLYYIYKEAIEYEKIKKF